MWMTDGEIVRSYKNAQRERNQVRILADLNCTDKETIIRILIAGGIPEETLRRKGKGRKNGNCEKEKRPCGGHRKGAGAEMLR